MQFPPAVPVMTLRNATLFPQALLPLYIFEARYRRMLSDVLHRDRVFCVALARPERRRESPCVVAGLGLVRVAVGHADGTSHLILQGVARVRLGAVLRHKPYPIYSISPLQVPRADSRAVDALVSKVHELVEQRMHQGQLPFPLPLSQPACLAGAEDAGVPAFSISDVLSYLRGVADAGHLADLVSCALLPQAPQRQSVLEAVDVETRLRRLIKFLMAEIQRHPETSN
jgi:Lon protease-like protein